MKHGKERGHQPQWAAQFAVTSELCKRGYEVAFTSGHTRSERMITRRLRSVRTALAKLDERLIFG